MKKDCINCIFRVKGLFSRLLTEQKDKIFCVMEMSRYKKKQILFIEGNKSYFVYAIKSGHVKLYTSSKNGQIQILKIMTAGDLLGFDVIYNDRYSFSAEVLKDSEICFMNKVDFIDLLEKNPDLSMGFIKVLMEEIENLRNLNIKFGLKSASHKVASLLHQLSTPTDKEDENIQTIHLPFSRKEISEFIRVTQETVSRVLNKFQRDNIIRIDKNKITIIDPEKIASLSQP